jgi:uncharacterized protein (DUF2141 family)
VRGAVADMDDPCYELGRSLPMPRTILPLFTLSLLFACTDAVAQGGAPADVALESVTAAATPGVLSLRISGFHSAAGQVLIAIYRGEDGFPGKPESAQKQLVAKISAGQARVEISDLPPGEYAVSVVHDENGNNTLDTNWVGIPKEGVGMSNNARGRMGPPKYRDAKFTLGAAGAVQSIAIVYL